MEGFDIAAAGDRVDVHGFGMTMGEGDIRQAVVTQPDTAVLEPAIVARRVAVGLPSSIREEVGSRNDGVAIGVHDAGRFDGPVTAASGLARLGVAIPDGVN